jgi:hypothetical protein
LNGDFIDILRFDHTFFGINAKAANTVPHKRSLLEPSFEASSASA